MLKPLEILKAFIEKGARNSANDAAMHQTIHDHSVSLGAVCSVSEAADFSNNDVMTLLNSAVKKEFKNQYSYPYIQDVYDDYLVFSSDYSSASCVKCSYNVSEGGIVTLGTPTAVVRKVTYIEPSSVTQESGEIELEGDSVALVENVDNVVENELLEAKSRVVKLIAPGWGSSGYYPADVLKRDGPNVFKAGLHNFIDHPTAIEERDRPEGSLNKLASTLLEDATWKDDYKGHGPGLYSTAKVNDTFGDFLGAFSDNIGMSIRASGKVKIGEIDGKKGPIVESITAAKSVDYVTLPGAGGKVLELFESSRKNVDIKESGVPIMADEKDKVIDPTIALQETINRLNARFVRSEATSYVGRVLLPLKVKESVKARISDTVLRDIPLNGAGDIDVTKFDAAIKAAVDNETSYLNSVGVFGQITGFGESGTKNPEPIKIDDAMKRLDESLAQLT